MKDCKKCGENKPLDEFYVSRRAKDGRQACANCHRIRTFIREGGNVEAIG